MTRPCSSFFRASLLGGSLLLLAASGAAAPLPSLPTHDVPRTGGSSGALDLEQLRRGVVQVEQGGRPIAIGTVLSKDGRVLTSLSALGSVEQPEIRYADGTVAKTKVGHKDKSWDLALLVPQSGKWVDGLVPTDADPSGLELKAFLPKSGKLAASGVVVKRRFDARTTDGESLRNVLDVDLKGLPGVLGAPLLDPNGKVVGVLARACGDAASVNPASKGKGDDSADAGKTPRQCPSITVGVPVVVLRTFLVKTPSGAVQPAPWLGLGGAETESGNVKGVQVMGVAPGSPAEKAGLIAGGPNPDTIVAVDGTPVETPEQLADVISRKAIGQSVKLLVFSRSKFREAAVTLRAAP